MRNARQPNMGGETSALNPIQQLQIENKSLKNEISKLKEELSNFVSKSNITDEKIIVDLENENLILKNKLSELDILLSKVEKKNNSETENNKKISELKLKVSFFEEELLKKQNEILNLEKKLSEILKVSSEPVPNDSNNEALYMLKFKELRAVSTINTFRGMLKESEQQGTEYFKISRRKLEQEYLVNPAHTTQALKVLEEHGYITVKFESETNRKRLFKILKLLPLS